MIRKALIASLSLCVLLSVAAAQEATSQPATGDDLQSLKEKIKDQDKRIEQLEAATGKNEEAFRQIQREEILKILKDMKVEADKHSDLRVFWRDGIRAETADGDTKLHMGIREQVDWTWFREDGFNDHKPNGVTEKSSTVKDGAELRRSYFTMDGQIYKNIDFCFQYDFVGLTTPSGSTTQFGTPKPIDDFIRLKNIPVVGDIEAGHFNEPFEMEQLTSDANQVFMERSLANALAPARNLGFQAHNAFLPDSTKTNRMTYATGMFRDTDDYGFQQADGGYNWTSRVTGLPLYEDKGQELIHLGLAYSYRNPQSQGQFRARPEDAMAPYLIDTGKFNVDKVNLFGGEVAGVYKAFHAEGELTSAATQGFEQGNENYCFNGFYAEAGYFITGESKPYNPTYGIWDRVKPNKNFRENGGLGAWEVAARYSYLNLEDKNINGGRMEDVTVGLNWYLNPNVKVMWDYVHSGEDNWSTSSDAFLMRFQIDF